jgi:hypothetical protein
MSHTSIRFKIFDSPPRILDLTIEESGIHFIIPLVSLNPEIERYQMCLKDEYLFFRIYTKKGREYERSITSTKIREYDEKNPNLADIEEIARYRKALQAAIQTKNVSSKNVLIKFFKLAIRYANIMGAYDLVHNLTDICKSIETYNVMYLNPISQTEFEKTLALQNPGIQASLRSKLIHDDSEPNPNQIKPS